MDHGKSVLVTGGAAGIGAGVARRFAEAGYAVAVFDIDSAGANRMAGDVNACSRGIAIPGDVANDGDAHRAVEETVAAFGAIDVLVNNAGIELNAPVTELTPEQWDRQLAVNLRGTFLFSKYAIERMKGRGGAIVNISSVHAFMSWRGSAAYDATKAGIVAMTRAMAIDHGPDGIRVNAICPGYIHTPLMDHWMAMEEDPEAAMRQIAGYHPVGRIGTPRDVAEAALFLASGAAAFITGTTLVVDGGFMVVGR